jgi:hypothetical protein
MKKISCSVIALSLLLLCGCASTQKLINQGKVQPSDFHSTISFTLAKSVMLIPCEAYGKTTNYIFDSGAQVTAVQRDSLIGEIIEVRGATNRVVENGTETIPSLKIGTVNFINTFASNEDMVGLKEQIPNFGGVLGQSVISKANWLIDYPGRTIQLSNKDLSDDSFQDIRLDPASQAPKTFVTVDGQAYKAIIDMGSTAVFNVPEDTELARRLLEKYEFSPHTRDRYTVGGLQMITEMIGVLPELRIGDLIFKEVRVNINQSSQIRLGMKFFEDYLLYIDNDRKRYRLKAG